ncbi:MAG: hypothetical protein V1878_08885 [bacterium]
MSQLIKVVRERYLPYYPGIIVQSVLTPEERALVLEGRLRPFARYGHEIGLGGALSPGSEVILREVEQG